MALTGLQIYKLLPQTNCKECGFPTCLAFAMKLAAKQVSLDLCPDASEEAKATLGAASVPPIRKIEIGRNERRIELGEEVVLFRHDKTFYHPTVLALGVKDDSSEEDFQQAVKTITQASYERAGETISISMLALVEKSGNPANFTTRAKSITEISPLPVVLVSDNLKCIEAGAKTISEHGGLIYGASPENASDFARVAAETNLPLVLKAASLEELAPLVEKVTSEGVKDVLIDPGFSSQAHLLQDHTLIRRFALDRKEKGFGYPSILAISPEKEPYEAALIASLGIAKYAGLIILPDWRVWQFLPILTLRQNIYTDPQKPLQVEAGIYNVGEPDENSPVYVTTNFSLTYFMLSSEIDASGEPAHLVIVDAEGMSVLTAWSAGKFGGEQVGKFVLGSGIADKISHRRVIIPGYVAVIKGEMEDAMPGWEIMVGPQEASDVPAFVKDVWMEVRAC